MQYIQQSILKGDVSPFAENFNGTKTAVNEI